MYPVSCSELKRNGMFDQILNITQLIVFDSMHCNDGMNIYHSSFSKLSFLKIILFFSKIFVKRLLSASFDIRHGLFKRKTGTFFFSLKDGEGKGVFPILSNFSNFMAQLRRPKNCHCFGEIGTKRRRLVVDCDISYY